MIPIDYPIPQKEKDLLGKLVDLSLKYDQCTGEYVDNASGMDFTIYERLHVDRVDMHAPLTALENLGFIKIEKRGNLTIFFLLGESFQYVKYMRMNKFQKFIHLAFQDIMSTLGVIGFIISTILGVIELFNLIAGK